MSADFSCYGETLIKTPAVDQLAKEGTRFTRAYATSPVCSTFRSSLITGMYQTSIGVHNHRSGRRNSQIELPEEVRPIPEILQEAGYWTCNGSGLKDRDFKYNKVSKQRLGKTDYNFEWNQSMYNSHDWEGRKGDQPFFMQVQLNGGKLRGASQAHYDRFDKVVQKEMGKITPPSKVSLPPYYPKEEIMQKDWSTYLDTVRITDLHVGKVIERLKKEGLLKNTLIAFFTDHGISHARGKQFLYDEGTHIPLIVRGPGVQRAATRTDLVTHIDVAALSLAAAGIPIPAIMEGNDILSPTYTHKPTVYGARDRCGEAVDHIRSVRSDSYLYIRNFLPERPHLAPSDYKDSKLIVQRLRKLHAEKKLPKLAEKLLFSPTRSPEELYLYKKDRWQVTNLASNPKHLKALINHRNQLEQWITETGDHGRESPEVYALEVQDELDGMKPSSARYKNFKGNAELYKKWDQEGR